MNGINIIYSMIQMCLNPIKNHIIILHLAYFHPEMKNRIMTQIRLNIIMAQFDTFCHGSLIIGILNDGIKTVI